MERRKVKKLVRVCEPTYSRERLQNHGIELFDWEFGNGHPPPNEIIDKWLTLVKDYFWQTPTTTVVVKQNDDEKRQLTEQIPNAIAIHCVSGLGRAPVLVGIALLEAGMNCNDVIYLIRT